MKLIIAVITISVAVVACGTWVPGGEKPVKYVADKDFLMKQKFFFEILRNIHIPLQYEEYMMYTKSWVEDKAMYKNYEIVEEFFNMYKMGMFLDKGEVFTVYNKYFMKQTYMLFSFLYNSLDWDTYYKNVIWARENINEGMFIYAVTLTVMHRMELQGMVLPAIYEIYPYYFFNTDMIRSATYRKMYDPKFGFYGSGKYNVVYSNYTMTYPWEVSVAEKDYVVDYKTMDYYYGDVGLNSFYYYFMMDYPFFLNNDKFDFMKERSGELYLYMHQQLLARYNLERFSNYMYPVMGLSWKFPLKMGYFSLLSYWNGMPFKSRDYNYLISDEHYYKLDWIKDWETRVRKMIDDGYYMMDDGTKIDMRKWYNIDFLGRMMNCMDVHMDYKMCKFGFIEMMSRTLLSGMDFMSMKSWPSALMHFETSLRDPMFYSMWNRLLDFYYLFKSYLPYYTFNELNFKGVVIKDVVIDKLLTYFEYFDSDISNVVPMTDVKKYWDFSVLGRTMRLNHKPFSYSLDVMSEYAGKGVLRVFLGPKFDKMMELDYYKKFFVEIDQYVVDLIVGKNTFVRNSRDFFWSVKDRTSYVELYKKMMMAFDGKEEFVLDMSEAHCGFPDRMILPKGWASGMKMQFYFVITPYTMMKPTDSMVFDKAYMCGGFKYVDKLPMGFPFDREINYTYWYTKNMLFKDVWIYHKDDVNKTY
ncbi:hexamerin-1.1-like [Wyeomyia smithii]|uniref:hexamerin-1.1-like n=1 Tax=Wyeomyia smithii TaxID=174621 RepID=UPI002467B64A|nr:hexamerin-1.1-like [Wyeomyia smithii]